MLVRYDQNDMELVIDNETGEAFATVRGAARMLSVDPSTVSRRTSKGLYAPLVKTSEIETGQGVQRVLLISVKLLTSWASKDNPDLVYKMAKAGFVEPEEAVKHLSDCAKTTNKQKYLNVEKKEQLKLCSALGGKLEVSCPAGRIDILTAEEIIEVKKISSWKNALGQVLAYKYYYPTLRPRIHLVGECHETFYFMIEKVCGELGVTVTLSDI